MIEQFQGEFRWLSNFWECYLPYEGIHYRSSEAAYQASKYEEEATRLWLASMSPAETKRFAKQNPATRQDWEILKRHHMLQILRVKFDPENNPTLARQLLATGDAHIQEGNYWNDTYWGVDLRSGEGLNHLGNILMRVREELRNHD